MKFLELYNLLIHEAQFVNKPKWEYQLKDHTGKTYNLGRKKNFNNPKILPNYMNYPKSNIA